ncbi:MAG: sulfate adenylyltransferase [Patescibacteria group bacterium]
MPLKQTKIIVTLGPSTRTEELLWRLKDKGVDFVRINMSHSSLEDLSYFIALAKKVGFPFVIDTEGSQIRTGVLSSATIYVEEGEEVALYAKEICGDTSRLALKPGDIIEQLEPGDILHLDFDTLMLRVSAVATADTGYITAKALTAGYLGNNKGVVVDSGSNKRFSLPCLTEKDYQSIAIGLSEGIGYIAASFMRSKAFVEEVRRATKGAMKIISKIECADALENLDEIIAASDYLLIDRGDLSKEIPLEKIPLTQKMILHRARAHGKGVFVATNLLETMVEKRKPTRAEAHDVVNTIMDGAYGLALSAETAIGKHPLDCVNMLNRLISHVEQTVEVKAFADKEDKLVKKMEIDNYLLSVEHTSGLVAPHGGKLVDRMAPEPLDPELLARLPRVQLSQELQMDAEQIAIGAFSPLEGFMGKKDLESVLDTMRLTSGVVWPLPILLDVSEEQAESIKEGQVVALVGQDNEIMALLDVDDTYQFDKEVLAEKLYKTLSDEHQGVRRVKNLQPFFLGGKITLLRRRESPTREYELTPAQVRRLFAERGWSTVIGFHTRNVIHRSHEFIQLHAMEQVRADGLFVHPVIGKKKPGDFQAKYIIGSYEIMMKQFYPKNKVVFATFGTFSRYAGPREAVFTALCRKNFGCSHFIVGRDHTGVGNFYHPTASHDIFDEFPDLGIIPVRFNQIFYSEKKNDHIHEADDHEHREEEKLHISGTQARKMFEQGSAPPEWFMRPEISRTIIEAIERGEDVFVKDKEI